MAEERWKIHKYVGVFGMPTPSIDGPTTECPVVVVPEARAKKAEEQRDRLLSAYKVWKDATLKRCKLLSSRESSDSMLFPDQAFIETADRIAREVRDDGGRS